MLGLLLGWLSELGNELAHDSRAGRSI